MKNEAKDEKWIPFSRYGEVQELRAIDPTETTGYVIEGYAIVYEQKVKIGDLFYETVKRGALDGADLTDVPLFIHHNRDKIPLARSRRNNGNSTLKLTPDDKGLHFRAELDVDNNTEAKALYSAVKRGDVTGMSYAFLPEKENWLDMDKAMPSREITKFKKIGEISALWSPAYSKTSIEARDGELDSSDKQALDNARSALESEKNELELRKRKLLMKAGMK